ncbi:TlpA disulfide reductase family protein [Mucilaginibacter flavidus]|uniref:TlpA disulfide reductase family protein n=1 Tax=Mucilaginibacter flavidus TaxID=2949309 RepID=UPI002092C96F|nr:TlpA disulfide reductase family protein [Mucilaginibacter flavidus]MCO5945871.1 AhpC/TSA family protein [Mucilaginibacter flavidus]
MKYKVTLLLLLAFKLTYSQFSYSLKVLVPGAVNGSTAYFKIWDFYSNHKFKKLDSAVVVNSEFSINGVLNKPCERAVLSVKENGIEKIYLQLIVDSGINKIIITKVDSDYYENKLRNTTFNSISNLIDNKIDSLNRKFEGNKNLTSAYKQESKLEVIKQFPNSFYSLIALRILSNQVDREQASLIKTFQVLDESLRRSALGLETDSILLSETTAINQVKAGNKVPQFFVKTANGKIFANGSLTGKPYIIAFSATWCIPCQIYQKKLLSIYHRYKSKNLKVVYFNLDDDVVKWRKHIIEKKLDWINVSERTKFKDSKIAKQFYAISIPLYIIVDKTGTIIYNGDESQDTDYNYLEQTVNNYLKD